MRDARQPDFKNGTGPAAYQTYAAGGILMMNQAEILQISPQSEKTPPGLPNPPPNFTTFLFYDTWAFFLITSKVPDARQQGSSSRSRIQHTSQGDAAAANAAGGILMVDQGSAGRLTT